MLDHTLLALAAALRTVTIALALFVGALVIAAYWDRDVFFSALQQSLASDQM